MKLHLPKRLFTALLAVFTLTATPAALTLGSTAWGAEESGEVTGNDSPAQEEVAYSGTVYTYKGVNSGTELAFSILTFENADGSTGQISGVSGNWGSISSAIATNSNTVKNTLRFDAEATTPRALTYTFNPIKVAGFIVESGATGYSITSQNTYERHIEIGNADSTKAYTTINEDFSLNNTSDADSHIYLWGNQEWQVASGKTYTLTSGTGGVENKQGGNLTITGGGTVKFGSTFINNGTVTVNAGSRMEVGNVTGNGSLVLNGSGDYTQDGQLSVANDGSTTTLGGNIYLVEDAKIKSAGTYAITINGTITDVIDGVDTGSVLTIEGQGYQIAGTMQVSGLELVGGSSRMDFLGGSTLQVEQTIQNAGTISLEGDVVFNSINFDNYEALGLKYSSSHSSKTSAQSGYRYADQIVLISGTVINNATSITGNQTFTAEVQDGIGLVGTFSKTVIDETTFYVNENAVWDSTGFEDNAATHYVVAAECTFDVNWDNDSGDDMNGKNIVLKDNATLVNGSTSDSGAYDANIGWQQLSSITLQDDASVGGYKQFGLLGGNYSATTLTLNGHTLTKQGSNTFLLINTTVDAGDIDIQEGDIQVGYNQGTKLTDASKATVKLSGGSLTIYSGDTFKIAGLTGDNTSSKIKGSGNIQLVGSGTYESKAELSGSVKLIVDNTGGSQTLHVGKDWTGLSTSGAINLKAGSLTLILDADATLNKTSITTGAASLLLDGSGTYNLGSHTAASTPALNLTLDTSWEGTVTLSGGNRAISLTGLSGFSNPNSKLKLTGFKGYLSGTDTKMSNNLILENTTVNIGGVDKAYALRLDNGTSEEDTVITFTGTIEGDGNIVYAWKNDANKQPTRTATHVFSKSTEDWNGMFIRDLSLTESDRVYGKYVTAKFTAGGDVFGANGTGGVKDAEASGKLTVEIAAGNNSTNFRGTIEDVANVVVNSDTTFQKKVTTEELTIAAGKTTTINDTLTAGNVQISQQNAVLSNVTVQGSSITATSTKNGAKGNISNAQLTQLAQDASFTIQDMTLTNTTITAASVNSKVNLVNVDATDVVLAEGKFTMNAAPVVGLGGTEATFNTGVSSLTAGAATLILNLDMIGAYESTGAVSGATLTITLGVSGADFSSYTVENWQALVGFDQESWLGQALVDATFTTEAVAAPAEADSAAPTVSYGYAAGDGGSNVGMLTITITGLNVPEPATATLSLLALAALTARRRRKA